MSFTNIGEILSNSTLSVREKEQGVKNMLQLIEYAFRAGIAVAVTDVKGVSELYYLVRQKNLSMLTLLSTWKAQDRQ